MKKYGFEITWKNILVMIICIGVNVGLKTMAVKMKLPFWLDSVGTCGSACLLGPIAGALVGLLTNTISVFTVGISTLIFAIANVLIGIIVGLCEINGFNKTIFGALCTGLITSFIGVTISVIIYVSVNKFTIGNVWGQALYEMISNYHFGNYFSLICGECFIDLPDKILTLVTVYVVLKVFKLRQWISGEKIEEAAV